MDDAVVHCVSERQARQVLAAIGDRMEQVGLRLHPDKTRIVYCKDGKTAWLIRAHVVHVPGVHVPRPLGAAQGREPLHRVPARDQQRRPEEDQRRSPPMAAAPAHRHTFAELARRINPIVRGWMQYYGAFYRSALYPLLQRINAYLVRWIRKKYKRLQAFTRPRHAGSGSPSSTPGCSRTGRGPPIPAMIRVIRAV